MKRYHKLIGLIYILSITIVLSNAAQASDIQFVDASADTIRVGMPRISDKVSLVGRPIGSGDIGEVELLFRGEAHGHVLSLDRYSDSACDRMFYRFHIEDGDGNIIGQARCIDQLGSILPQGNANDWPKSLKGLQDIREFQDALDLGVKHETLNISLASLLSKNPKKAQARIDLQFSVDGKQYFMDSRHVERLDATIKRATVNGINVIAILLLTMPRGQHSQDELSHPSADFVNSPTGVFAFNTTSAEAQRRYRAVVGFLARRYSRPDRKYGCIGGYIVGNEVQSHWYWHNMGKQTPEAVVRQYADQVRLTYYAVRNECRNPRIFISMDHHWTGQQGNDPLMTMPGRKFLDDFSQAIQSEGNIPWHVAFHPYPENLFDPCFWNDIQATYSFDTPKITFRNIEVLVEYLRRPEFLYQGKPRRVILSEQGFHAGTDDDAEIAQAAAFAASYVRVSAMDGIDAYILHRHVDHPGEGGLNLGLRKQKDGMPHEKRRIFDVYQAAETDQQNEAFQFALPVIGIDNWSEMAPRKAITTHERNINK
ncbi:DUF5722 domain-containing protein [Bremerella sp. P1]|nr:DUF5722 domain-containing protein [Bremerella sp. P1]WDI41040.1 DUF5722 domain-containing protein [Bremerella sp. P1]